MQKQMCRLWADILRLQESIQPGHQCLCWKSEKGRDLTAGARPGMDIWSANGLGLEGTSIIAKRRRRIKNAFCSSFYQKAKALDAYISVQFEATVALTSGVSAMHDVTEGGIFQTLWEMAEASGVGLEIGKEDTNSRQEQ